MKIYNWRTIWISDTHLGTRACKASRLLGFLQHNIAENYYLVGDIIDTWNLDVDWFWTDYHNEIVRLINSYEVVWLIAGNHDTSNLARFMESFPSLIPIEAIKYNSLKNGQLLVTHGHQFDASLFQASSDFHFSTAMTINNWSHTKGTNPIKQLVGKAITKLTDPRMKKFYSNILKVVASRYDGIICGHIHSPKIKQLTPKFTYYNTGDWLAHCSALVEDFNGEMKIIQ